MPEQYNRIARLLDHKVPVKLEFNIENDVDDSHPDCFNVIGEIPGTGQHKDEIVMLGAHFDSWQGGTGATDNGAGSAVMIEAVRVLKAANLSLDRTVRIALWGGEEEGLLGSRAYVKEHFGDRETMKLTSEHAKLAGYFNYDNGTGKIRGVYLQGNDMMRPIFEAWFEPFKDMGASTISILAYRWHRSFILRRRRPARLPVHSRSDGLQHPHTPLKHGRLRPHSRRRPDAGVHHHRGLRLQHRQPPRNASPQTFTQAATRASRACRPNSEQPLRWRRHSYPPRRYSYRRRRPTTCDEMRIRLACRKGRGPSGSLSVPMSKRIRSTTILCVRRNGKVVLAGDGQVTMGSEVLKGGAKKLRRLYNGKIISGFAGSTADAFALFARFEEASSNNTAAICRAALWNWPKNGVQTACCATWKRSCLRPTRRTCIL